MSQIGGIIVDGYMSGAAAAAGLIALLSTNSHDKSLEMVMPSIFVAGPMGAILGLMLAILTARVVTTTKS